MADRDSPFGRFWRGLFGGRAGASLRESVEEAIEEHGNGADGPSLSEGERTMLFNVLDYAALRVDDVMVPRTDIVAVDIDQSMEDMVAQFAEAAHSRLPVYRDDLDDVVGMIHVKDLVRRMATGAQAESFSVQEVKRPVLFVPASMRVRDLLTKMRNTRTHMAIVVDEYGGTDGLVTIEDLVEQIVGEIEDEHDTADEEPLLRALEGGWFDADARLEIEEFEEAADCKLVEEDADDDVDTLGGLVFSLAGRVPEIGEIIEHPDGYRFEVVDADPRRIAKLRIYPPDYADDANVGQA